MFYLSIVILFIKMLLVNIIGYFLRHSSERLWSRYKLKKTLVLQKVSFVSCNFGKKYAWPMAITPICILISFILKKGRLLMYGSFFKGAVQKTYILRDGDKKPISYSFFLESKICFIQFWKENMHGHHTNTYNNIFYNKKGGLFIFYVWLFL